MTKTLNRPPMSVKQLDYSDLGIKYFNFDSWKGLNEDKNYVGVDQSTFAECNNVFVDGENVLRSRPAMKILIDDKLQNIDKVWTFDIVTVYKCDTKLVFLKDGHYLEVNIGNIDDFVLVLADEKIFLFGENRIAYLDLSTWTVVDDIATAEWADSDDPMTADKAIDTIYVPTTTQFIEGTASGAESKNTFTSKEFRTYTYTSLESVQDELFIGQKVVIRVGSNTYEVIYNDMTKRLLTEKTYESAWHTDNIVCQERNNMLMAVYQDGYDFYYSVDLKVFAYLDSHSCETFVTPDGKLKSFLLSENNYFIAIISSGQVLVRSILATEAGGTLYWPMWTSYFGGNTVVNDINSKAALHIADEENGCCWFATDKYHTVTSSNTKYGTLKCLYKSNSSSVNVFTTPSQSQSFIGTVPKIESQNIMQSYSTFFSRFSSSNESTFSDITLSAITNGRYKYTFSNLTGTLYKDNGALALRNFKLTCNLTCDDVLIGQRDMTQSAGNVSITRQSTETLEFECSTPVDYSYAWDSNAPVVTIKWSINSGTQTLQVLFSSTSAASNTSISDSHNYGPFAYPMMDAVTYRPTCHYFKDNSAYMGAITVNNNSLKESVWITSNSSDLPYDNSNTVRYQWVKGYQSAWFFELATHKNISKYWITKSSSDNLTVTMQANVVYLNGEFSVYGFKVNMTETDTYFLTTSYLVKLDTQYHQTNYNLLRIGTPLCVGPKGLANYWHNETTAFDDIYSSYSIQSINISFSIDGPLTIPKITSQTQLDRYYFASQNKLYVNATGALLAPGEFKWYFPEINVQPFDYQITGLHPISTEAVAIFFEHGIWYTTWSDGNSYYFKSRIPLGCKLDNDIITTYDGRYTIFSTERGLVSMAYQDFISSTEQALIFLSDDVFDRYTEWVDNEPVKLTAYLFWLIVYKQNSKTAFIFDLRTNTWWPVSIGFVDNSENNQFYLQNNELICIYNKHQYYFDKSSDDYIDIENEDARRLTAPIDWIIMSQKIHFAEYYYRGERLINYDTLQYFKKVHGMRFDALSDTNDEVVFNINCITYDNTLKFQATKSVKYEIDFVSSIIKKMNYPKIQEFQFILSSSDRELQYPLKLTNIAIKYSITGQVK